MFSDFKFKSTNFHLILHLIHIIKNVETIDLFMTKGIF